MMDEFLFCTYSERYSQCEQLEIIFTFLLAFVANSYQRDFTIADFEKVGAVELALPVNKGFSLIKIPFV
jgi:hypothetical protein